MTARLTLISHAPTVALRRASFPLDEALDEKEIAKITSFNWQAPRSQRFLVAPECRAQQTADALGLKAKTDIDLRDCDYGTWGGREFDEVHSRDPRGIVEWLTNPEAVPHGGDSIANLTARVAHWLENQTETGHTIAVTHPTVIRAVIVQALNVPIHVFWRIDIAPLSVTDLRYNGKAWTLRSAACPLPKASEDDA